MKARRERKKKEREKIVYFNTAPGYQQTNKHGGNIQAFLYL
jgi:hypothetical protein